MEIKTITTIAVAITAVAGAGAVFGIKNFPRPAWASEVFMLASDLTELDSRVTTQQLGEAKLRYYQNIREQDKYDVGDVLVPDYLLEEQKLLDLQIDELEYRLDELRDSIDE